MSVCVPFTAFGHAPVTVLVSVTFTAVTRHALHVVPGCVHVVTFAFGFFVCAFSRLRLPFALRTRMVCHFTFLFYTYTRWFATLLRFRTFGFVTFWFVTRFGCRFARGCVTRFRYVPARGCTYVTRLRSVCAFAFFLPFPVLRSTTAFLLHFVTFASPLLRAFCGLSVTLRFTFALVVARLRHFVLRGLLRCAFSHVFRAVALSRPLVPSRRVRYTILRLRTFRYG